MSSTPSARFPAVEAAGMSFAHASEGGPHGGARWGDALLANARGGPSSGADQVCAHCGFARDVHARHCPVFADAIRAGATLERETGVLARRRAAEPLRALPAEEGPPFDDDLEGARKHGARPNLSEPQPKVLVADDHPVHRQLIRAIFEALACSVDVAEDGAAALALCAVEAFDLVIIDRHMPVLGGDEAVRRLRASGGPSSQAYVAICSSDPPSDRAAGYDAIAPKPLDVDTAHLLVTEAMSAAAARAEQN